jgi:recombination associated protein RdgC
MWFRNLQIYQLTETINLSAEELHQALLEQQFNPCRGLDTHRSGWTTPLGKHGDQLVHATNSKFMLCMRREDRILPAAVIREAVQQKVDDIEASEPRQVGRKEKNDLREEVTVDLLPRAFTRSTHSYAYIDPANDWVILDCNSSTKAEEVLTLIRESLGSFKVRPLTVNTAPSAVMTEWVKDSAPADLVITDECELREPVEKGGVIRIRGVDLGSQEVLQHLNAGKQVSRLALEWQDRISCVLADDLSIKRLKFTDLVMDLAADSAEDDAMRFDADFAIMASELSNFIPALCHHLGGIDKG